MRHLAPSFTPRKTPARLVIDGPGQWVYCHELSIFRESVIGRHAHCDVQLKSGQISSRHARVFWDGQGFAVEDLDSSNGTRLNGAALAQAERLADGDHIGIGSFVVSFKGEDSGADPSATLAGESVEQLLERRRHARKESVKGAAKLDKAPVKPPAESIWTAKDARALRSELDKARESLAEARRANRRLTLQRHLGRFPLVSAGETDCYRGMVETVQTALGADSCFLMLINFQTKAWEIKAWSGGLNALEKEANPGAPTASMTLAAASLNAGKAMTLADLPEGDLGMAESIAAQNIQTGAAAPIFLSAEGSRQKPKIIGCLYADQRKNVVRDWGAEEAADLSACAGIFAEVAQYWALR